VDNEIALLIVKKKKFTQAKYIDFAASLPSGLNNLSHLLFLSPSPY